MIQTLTSSEARNNFAQVLDKAHFHSQRFLIKKQKRPYAVLIGIQDYEDVLEVAQKADKPKRRKPSFLARIAKIKCKAKVPKDLSANFHKYYNELIYETSFRGSKPSVVRDRSTEVKQ